ncbi:MAG: T9SS type A sorting domain-containing protein [Chitinophagaceae bacterium]|nr:T9SS type A sorting domain-containing protein [Chitinophagaceae bacterium]
MQKIIFTTICLFYIGILAAQTTTGMVAYFPMNGTITDAGPNSIAGTNFGATATNNKAGVPNSAMSFANPASTVPQYATHAVNANTSFGATQNFTIAFAVLINTIPHAGGLYDNNLNYGGPGVWLWNANGFPQIQFNFKNNSVGSTNGAIPLSTWRHVAAVRNNGTLSIYINGILNASAAEGTTAPIYSFPARIGSMFYNGFTPPQYNGLNGNMDELRIYNRALSAAEIQTLSSTVLPIKLTNFTATQNNNEIKLAWQTAGDFNASHFTVQRSADGNTFTGIAKVNTNGNANTTGNYSYTDAIINSLITYSTIYYRLQMTDTDGKTQYSNVVVVKLNNTTTNLLALPANTVTSSLTLLLNSTTQKQIQISITDAMGRLLCTNNIVLTNTIQTIYLPVHNLPKGLYYVTASSNAAKETKQFLKY